jgi:hypothetical protein
MNTTSAAKIVFEIVRRDCGNYSAHALAPHRINIEARPLSEIPGAVERVLQRYLGRDPLPEDFELRPSQTPLSFYRLPITD